MIFNLWTILIYIYPFYISILLFTELIMIVSKPFDIQLFNSKLHHFLYNFNEMNHLIDALDYHTDTMPVTRIAMELLSATQDFLCATTLENEFATKRQAILSDVKYFEKIFDEITNAIDSAEKHLLNHTSQEEHGFLESAIDYCYKAILIRLLELKEANDPFYTIFWQNSSLRKKLQTQELK